MTTLSSAHEDTHALLFAHGQPFVGAAQAASGAAMALKAG